MDAKVETRRTIWGKWMLWGAVVVGMLALLLLFAKALQTNWALRREFSELEPQVTAAYAENSELTEKLTYVQSDEYVAEWSQVHARMTQDGETLIIPVQLTPTPTPTPVVVQSANEPLQEPFYVRWWQALFGD